MLRKMMIFGTVVLLAYGALCVALYFFQRSLIYFPQPRAVGLGLEPVVMTMADGTAVNVTVRPNLGPDALIYFGGNAEDVSHQLPALAAAFPDHAIHLMHYRGYGGSGGQPTEDALVADALALFDRVHQDHERVLVVGRSLGSGVAVQLASERPVARMVLVTPYHSILALAQQQFPWAPVGWLLQDRYESWRHAPKVSAPTTLIAAEQDNVIPRTSTDALHAHFAPGVARFHVLPGTGHNTISDHRMYLPLLQGEP
ncbi:MAG TPA: alpha/beta fold hydrolase [Hydrogenophaga sp.]|nr:alpha/beta fold hydrolase [Hydrogenophaga sp.]